jgi:Holliday junction resolvase RusA-like endonuclease
MPSTSTRLVFDIKPVAKGRARSGIGHHYTPSRTRDYEDYLRVSAREQYDSTPMYGPLAVDIVIVFGTKKKERWGDWHIFKPDGDNLEKAVFDALKGIIWLEDCLIADHRTRKYWGEESSVVVTVSCLEMTAEDISHTMAIAKRPSVLAVRHDPCANEVIDGDEYLERVKHDA